MNVNNIFSIDEIDRCSDHSGIYWLYKKFDYGWDVVYIGISVNIRRRLRQHLQLKDFDGFFYEETDYDLARERERRLLSSYKEFSGILPKENSQI